VLLLRFVPFLGCMVLGAVIFLVLFGGIGSIIEGAIAGFIVGALLMVLRMTGVLGKKPATTPPPTDSRR
jgi:hypothetical protein